MAVRSGAGTGVIVSLVVFVLTTVFLLILTIVFYAGKTTEIENRAKAESELAAYVKPAERTSDRFKAFEQAAGTKSVSGYLAARHDELMGYVNGDASPSLDELKSSLARYGVQENDSLRGFIEDMSRRQRSAETEINGLRDRLAALDEELREREAELERAKQQHDEELQTVSQNIVNYRNIAEQYGDDVNEAIDELTAAKERLRDQYDDRIAELEDELDARGQDLVLLRSRVDEYEAILNDLRIKSRTPELLVDGHVVEVDPATDQVFIDRGRKNRIVLGMTFEVYDDVTSIRVDPRTGTLPRGKASLQVTKVGETTSTCKITRVVPGRPVVRNNVIANAVYDPAYRFKFLIHGKFDADGDGRPSEAEADFLRSLVIDWGGEVVYGDELPGDLDFLVLGEMPPLPPQLPTDARPHQIDQWAKMREARMKYESLFKQASEAQIPVLNANRFHILTGRTDS